MEGLNVKAIIEGSIATLKGDLERLVDERVRASADAVKAIDARIKGIEDEIAKLRQSAEAITSTPEVETEPEGAHFKDIAKRLLRDGEVEVQKAAIVLDSNRPYPAAAVRGPGLATPTVDDIFTVVPLAADGISMPETSGAVPSASTVADGVDLPEASISTVAKHIPLQRVGFHKEISQNVLTNWQAFEAFVRSMMLAGVKREELNQVLNGNGTGSNVRGLGQVAVAYAAPTGEGKYDSVRKAIVSILTDGYSNSAYLVNPTDYNEIQNTTDAGGNRLFMANEEPVVIGVPPQMAAAVAAGTAFVGDFRLNAAVFRKPTVTFRVTNDTTTAKRGTVMLTIELSVGVWVAFYNGFRKITFA